MRHYYFLFIFICIVACKQQKVISDYNKPISDIEAYFLITPSSDSITNIIYTISASDLYTQSSKNSKSYIYFEVENYDENKNQLIQSYTSPTKIIYVNNSSDFIQGSFALPFYIPQNSSIRIRMLNTYNTLLHSYTYYIPQEKESFEILQNNTRNRWFKPYVYVDTCVFINIVKNKEYLFYTFEPPYMNALNKPIPYRLPIIHDSVVVPFTKIGNYTFYSDSLLQDTVFSIPAVSKKFPKNNSACIMLTALQLINPLLSLDSLLNTRVGCKIELDKQWLSIADNNEMKAKEAINSFYSRIEKANKLYTITKQGMYSDRGICLILLGEPQKISYSVNSEIWYYSNDTTIQEKKFIFDKKNIGIQSEYYLKNKNEKKIFIDFAQLNWQRGNVFTLQ